MSQLNISEYWITGLNANDAIRIVKIYFEKSDIKIERENAGSSYIIYGYQGSGLKARAIGVPFISHKDLPKKITIEFAPINGTETKVTVRIEDNFGFSGIGGNLILSGPYAAAGNELMTSFRDILPPSKRNGFPSEQAKKIFQMANDKWNNAKPEERNEGFKRDVASLLMASIKKSEAPFPEAESQLALFLDDLGDDEEAKKYALAALREWPDDFRARLVMVDYHLKGVKVAKLNVSSFIETGAGGIEGNAISSVFKSTMSLIGAANAAMTQSEFKNELTRLIETYRRVCKTTNDVDEFIYMGESLILVGDVIKNLPMVGGRLNLFQEVADAPTGQLQMGDREVEVIELCAKAEGRSAFFKP